MPRTNQLCRCSADPCVHDSGTTRPCVRSWMRSSPTAAAASSASATSWRVRSSTNPVPSAWPTHRPAKQSACSSTRTWPPCGPVSRSALSRVPIEVLNVVSVLVREDVRLGERPAASAELRLELVEEPEVDVDVAVARTVERARRRRRRAAARLDPVLEEARLRRLVAPKRAVPVRLDAVDDRDDPAVLAFVRIGTGLAVRGELARRRARADRLARERPEIPEPARRH